MDKVVVSRISLHMWEEPCISGEEGSGTVFFAGCPLHCVFCQNTEIAETDAMRPGRAEELGKLGWKAMTEDELADAFLRLRKRGANNINLVTPTHFIPQIIRAVSKARDRGLRVPVVYNTGTYETPESVRLLADTVDIFLPDLKFCDAEVSARYAQAPDYFETASAAVEEMVKILRRKSALENSSEISVYDERGMMRRGIIVRHLILPGHTKDSMRILRYLYERYGDEICISIMNQYTPMEGIGMTYPELARKVTKREYEKVIGYALDLGISNAFIQEGGAASESFIPSFRGEGIREDI